MYELINALAAKPGNEEVALNGTLAVGGEVIAEGTVEEPQKKEGE